MKRIICMILAVIFCTITVYGESDQEDLGLYAQSAVLIDGDSGRVLYSKLSDQFRPMASTTKIMTCILALEYGNLEDVVTASSYAASQPKVHLGIRSGQQFYLKDLLYSLMLESHNDSAVMIAEHLGQDVEGFAALMNQKARDLGCDNTNFITPNGLDAKITLKDGSELIHATTAEDLARIMRYCIMESPKKDDFLTITRTSNHYFQDVSGKRSYSCTNHNALLNMMEGAISGKTGFTSGAGYSYVGAIESEGRTYILALLGCGWPPHKTYKWSDARELFAYGKDNYQYREVFEPLGEVSVAVSDGIAENRGEPAAVALTLGLNGEDQTLKVLLKEAETVRIEKRIPTTIQAPVQKNQQVGSVDYYLAGERIKSYPVFTAGGVDAVSPSYYWNLVWSAFVLE